MKPTAGQRGVRVKRSETALVVRVPSPQTERFQASELFTKKL